jgi:hypothetical protein
MVLGLFESVALNAHQFNTSTIPSLLHTLPHTPTRRQYSELSAGAEHGAVVVFAEEGIEVHETMPVQRKAMAEAVVLHAAAVGTEFLRAFRTGNGTVALQAMHHRIHHNSMVLVTAVNCVG